MFKNIQLKINGFSLVEVMVALLVLSLGMVALAKFQGKLIRDASEAHKTSEAYSVAEDFIEYFRAYPSLAVYDQLDDGAYPQQMPFGVNQVDCGTANNLESDPMQLCRYTADYDITWSVDACYAGGVRTTDSDDQDIDACIENFGETPGVDWEIGGINGQVYKFLTVEVDPNEGEIEPVEASTIIQSADFKDTTLPPTDGDESNIAGNSALTRDTLSDEVQIQVDTGDDDQSRQAGKPLPDVVASGQRENTLVAFDVITYSPLAGDEVAVNLREEFLNVSCECELQSSGQSREPGHVQWSESGSFRFDKAGAVTNKQTGSATSNNAADVSGLCDMCCRDHHDSEDSLVRYDGELTSQDNHPHYDSAGNEVDVGGTYFESCRFKRIDGVMRVFQDWQLKDITVFASSDLDGSNPDLENAYVDYVADFVPDLSADKSTVNNERQPIQVQEGQNKQLQARGIYIDNVYNANGNLSTGENSYAAYDGDDKLEQTPFAEVNLTLLADWVSDNETEVTVTDEELDTVSSEENYFSNFYSRGRIKGIAETTSPLPNVYASIEPGTDGITDNANTDDVLDLSQVESGDEGKPFSGIEVEVAGQASIRTISGDLNVPKLQGNPDLTITPSELCTPSKSGGQDTYSCSVLKDESITISVDIEGYECDGSTKTFSNVEENLPSEHFVLENCQ